MMRRLAIACHRLEIGQSELSRLNIMYLATVELMKFFHGLHAYV